MASSSSTDPVTVPPRLRAINSRCPIPTPPPPPLVDPVTARSHSTKSPLFPPSLFKPILTPSLSSSPPPPPPPPPSQPVMFSGTFLPPPPPPTTPTATANYVRGNHMAFSTTAAAAASGGVRPPFMLSDQIGRQASATAQQFAVPRHVRPPSATAAASAVAAPVKSAGVNNTGKHKVGAGPATTSLFDLNNFKERKKSREDLVVTILDRKVRLSEGGQSSLYALCRSWIRNGMPRDNLPIFEDNLRILPRPLPEPYAQAHSSIKIDDDIEDDTQGNQGACLLVADPDLHTIVVRWISDIHMGSGEDLSVHELLEGHIKRAKRIRASLRKKRLLRIERYKQRLALLLPPPSELGAAPGS